jgi:DNA-binding transcriptional MerR regulator
VSKSDNALKTISELANELGVAQHILRYWETRFTQLRPLTRAGNRRYYRPDDVALARRIHSLLNRDGYTIKGAQLVLSGKAASPAALPVSADKSNGAAITPPLVASIPVAPVTPVIDVDALRAVRHRLALALHEDQLAAR